MNRIENLNKNHLRSLMDEMSILRKRFDLVREQMINAKSDGDFSENADWQKSLEKRDLIYKEILICEEKIKEWKSITEDSKSKNFFVYFDESVKEEKSIIVVNKWNVNPEEGRISKKSPLGAALESASEGHSITVKINNGDKKLKLLKKKNIFIDLQDIED